jgi:exopolysaccharide production protein ExoQ
MIASNSPRLVSYAQPVIDISSSRAVSPARRPMWATGTRWLAAATLVFLAANGQFSFQAGDNSARGALGGVTTSKDHSLLIFQIASFCSIAALVLPRFQMVLRAFRQVPVIASLTVLPLLSVLWSADRYASLKWGVFLGMTAVFAVWIAVALPLTRQLQLLFMTACTCVVLTILVSLLLPTYGIDFRTGRGGEWEGIFAGKNVCGYVMFFLLMPCTYRLGNMPIAKVSRPIVLALILFVILMTRSKAAFVITAAYFLFRLLLSTFGKFGRRSRTSLLLVGSAIAAPILALLLLNAASLLRLMDRDLTFSGRTQIWSALLLSVLKRPTLGYGFRAYWQSSESSNVMIAIGHTMAYAHNGFLGVALELGFVGVALIVMCFIFGWHDALACFRRDRPR